MPARADMLTRNAHLNLVQSSRQLFELDPGVAIEAGEGCLFGAGSSPHPISNAAFRLDDGLDPEEFLNLARAFFVARDRGFVLWARDGVPEDRDLIDAAEKAGMRSVHEMPEMVLEQRVEELPLGDGVELRRVVSADDADDYWRVATTAYASLEFPPEIFAHYENHENLQADNVAAFLACLEGRPAAIAMTIVSHGVAGIYWVGSTEEARGRGLGSKMTATAVNAGFDMGAETASLQASTMGESLYRRLGFETIFGYQLFLYPRPEEGP